MESVQSPQPVPSAPVQEQTPVAKQSSASRRSRRRRVWLALVTILLLGIIGLSISRYCLDLWVSRTLNEGRALLEQEKYTQARELLTRVEKVRPRDPTVHLLLARADRLALNFSEAEHHLNLCVKYQKKETEEVQLELLMFRAQTGEVDEVFEKLYPYVLRKTSQEVQVLEALSYGYLVLSRIPQADKAVRRWLELRPDSAIANYYAGRIALMKQDMELARSKFGRSVELNPTYDDARLDLARILISENEWKKAEPHLRAVLDHTPSTPSALVGLAECRWVAGARKEAIELVDRALKIDPASVDALGAKGRFELIFGTPQEAEKWLRKAEQLEPGNYNVVYNLLQAVSKQQGRQQEVEKISERVNQVKADRERMRDIRTRDFIKRPHDPKLQMEMAALLMRGKKYTEASYWLFKAYSLDKNDARICALMADYYEHQGDKAKAQRFRERSRELAEASSAP